MDRKTGSRCASLFTTSHTGGRRVQFQSGQVVYCPDTPAKSIYFVEEGQLRLFIDGRDGSTHLAEIVGPGEWFGVAAFAGRERYAMRAVAAGNVSLIEVPVDELRNALQQNPAQAIDLMQNLAVMVIRAFEDRSRYIFEDADQLLINALLRFSESSASTQHADGVTLRMTHQQLAQAIGVARETVSLGLTSLRHRNLLRTGRRQLIFNPDALRRFSESQAHTCLSEQQKVSAEAED